MITIDRLSLSLPSGFETRAANIAHELANALATLEPSSSLALRELRVPAVRVVVSASDAAIARDIAAAIGRTLGKAAGRT